MSIDFAKATVWDLAYELNPTNTKQCTDIDKHLAKKINSLDELNEIYYYLCYGDMWSLLPHTKIKINKLFKKEIKLIKSTNWSKFKIFADWLDDDIKKQLMAAWINNDDIDLDSTWMANSIIKDSKINLKVLEKLVRIYKKKKKSENIKIMENIFLNLDTKYVNDACNVLLKSTPAVMVTLLKRTDISEKHTIKGLKALSKLSKQRDLGIQIDFDMLKHLGPKGRLDAMKQLMGMFDKYYTFISNYKQSSTGYDYYFESRKKRLKNDAKNYNLPFKEIPKRSDIETFLFPCCIKYNDEVVSMLKRFDELVNQKEKE